MYASEVISQEEKQDLENIDGSMRRTEVMLMLLCDKTPDKFNGFLSALIKTDQQHIVNMICNNSEENAAIYESNLNNDNAIDEPKPIDESQSIDNSQLIDESNLNSNAIDEPKPIDESQSIDESNSVVENHDDLLPVSDDEMALDSSVLTYKDRHLEQMKGQSAEAQHQITELPQAACGNCRPTNVNMTCRNYGRSSSISYFRL
jgi:hypothetical protein